MSLTGQSSLLVQPCTFVKFEGKLPECQQARLTSAGHALPYLEEAELVGSLVGPDDQGLDIAHVDVTASDGEG